jgi:hypothetical protein
VKWSSAKLPSVISFTNLGPSTILVVEDYGWKVSINQDREMPHGTPPPTPPYVRVTYTAVR